MKVREHNWFNEKTRKVMYGIQAQLKPREKWMHVMENGKACVYETEDERKCKMLRLMADRT